MKFNVPKSLPIVFFLCALVYITACKKNEPAPEQPNPPTGASSLTITGLSTTSGVFTDKITITGTNFNPLRAENIVKFNGKDAYVESATLTQIVAVVPRAANSGPVTVTVNGSTATGPVFNYVQSFMLSTYVRGSEGYVDATGINAKFSYPSGITIDDDDNLYVTDKNVIRKITPTRLVTTIAGTGTDGYANGVASQAQFAGLQGIGLDSKKNIYVAELATHRIRKISANGIVTTFAGNGLEGNVDGIGETASLSFPTFVSVDKNDNVFVGTQGQSYVLKKILPDGKVTSYHVRGGFGSKSEYYGNMAIDASGAAYFADRSNYGILKFDPATSNSVAFAGYGDTGAWNNINTRIMIIYGMVIDKNGTIFLAQGTNADFIKKVTPNGTVSILYPQTYKLIMADAYEPNGKLNGSFVSLPSGRMTMDSKGSFYFIDNDNMVRRIIKGQLE